MKRDKRGGKSTDDITRRDFVKGVGAALLAGALPPALCAGEDNNRPDAGGAAPTNGAPLPQAMPAKFENAYAIYAIAADGQNLHLIDKSTGTDCCLRNPSVTFVQVKKAGRNYPASSVSCAEGRLAVQFGDSGVSAVVAVSAEEHYFVFEVLSVSGDNVQELIFGRIHLTLQGTPEEHFACCALALNLKTNVIPMPRGTSRLQASCYPRFGFAGARVAVIACPQGELREVLKEVVSAAQDLPHSPIGGPWALEPPINRGSYLFNFDGVSEQTVDDWIRLAQDLGMYQLDFHGGRSFRFGDCRPDPEIYPDGLPSLKAVIDRLHAAGIVAGLHTYSFFIHRTCPWVTPVPDPRLAKDATFTLAAPLTAEATRVPVVESPEAMSAITGFHVRNSVTLQVDDELITYADVVKQPPYVFTGCQRGACGTHVAPHAPGANVHHLKQCFNLFVPDGDSTLFEEVAARTAQAFNECGFDMIYLDALDGEDVLAGPENGWHYGSKFVFELWKRLQRPALMEMSTFHHHLWCVRSRSGAWDHPVRSYKKFIDIHCADNDRLRRIFMPGHLGWWAVQNSSGHQGEPTFADDFEYLLCKCLGTDTGFSLMGIDPSGFSKMPALQTLAAIIRRYEQLRLSNRVPDAVKAMLRTPGKEFTLLSYPDERWQFQPIQYARHKVLGMDGWSNIWQTSNDFARQPVELRIEALMSAGAYDAPANVTLADFSDPADFPQTSAASGVTASLQPSSSHVKVGAASGCFVASSPLSGAQPSWAMVGKVASPPLDLRKNGALGLWVHGDGKGEVLNIQLRSPEHITRAIGDHYVVVDFTGWRYFELIEPEGERYHDYSWPYGDRFSSIYIESVNYSQVESLSLWYNNVPPNETVTCYLSPIKALPLVPVKLRNPSLTIGGKTIVFPTEVETGCYLEFHSISDCNLYGPQGELIRKVTPQGDVPVIEAGENQVTFEAETDQGLSARARVTLISRGEPLGA